jgi:DNA-binding transcriptional regulator YiaG
MKPVFFYPDLRTEFVALRRELGLSQPAAGEALGRSAAWIRKMERGATLCPPYAVYAMRYLCAMRYLSEHPNAIAP